MSRILLVAPDATRREAIAEALRGRNQTSTITSVDDVGHAPITRGEPVDLIVAHAGMRTREGQLVELLLKAAARTPDARLLLLDDYLEESAARSASGAICWAPAAATPEHLADVATRILAGEEAFQGSLRELDLDDVVQLALGTGYQGTLRIRSGRRAGLLSFHLGVPVAAELGDADRIEALATFLALPSGSLLSLPFAYEADAIPPAFTQEELDQAYVRADEFRASGELVEVPPEEEESVEVASDSPASGGAEISFFDDDELAEFDAMGDVAAPAPSPPPPPAPAQPFSIEMAVPPPPAPAAPRVPVPALLADLGRIVDGTLAAALVDVVGGAVLAVWARNDAAHKAVPGIVEIVLGGLRATTGPSTLRSMTVQAWPHSIVVEFDGVRRALITVVDRPVLRTRLVSKLRLTLEAIQRTEEA